jgi:hypothetical protein
LAETEGEVLAHWLEVEAVAWAAMEAKAVAEAEGPEGMADRPRASAGEVEEELYFREGILPAT